MSEEKRQFAEIRLAVQQVGEGAERCYRLHFNLGAVTIEWNADHFDKFWETYKPEIQKGTLIYLPQAMVPKGVSDENN